MPALQESLFADALAVAWDDAIADIDRRIARADAATAEVLREVRAVAVRVRRSR